MRINPITNFAGGVWETQLQGTPSHTWWWLERGVFFLVPTGLWLSTRGECAATRQRCGFRDGSPGRGGGLLCRKDGQQGCEVTCWEDSHLMVYFEAEAF